MKQNIWMLFALLISISGYSQSFKTIFKDAEWLNKNLQNPELVILHVEAEDAYKQGHIQGAQFIGRKEYTITSEDSLFTQLPDVVYLDSLFRARGINDESIVILYYGSDRFAQTFRLYYTFDYMGLSKNVFILDGGLKNWVKMEFQTEVETQNISPVVNGKLTYVVNEDILASKEDVFDKLSDSNVRLIDARTSEYFTGEKDGDGYYKRPGHIQGAKNITWLNIIDENQMLKPKEVLRQFYLDGGINKKDEIITYCHVGLRATVLYTISKALGHKVSMYDGSINEWDRLDVQFPVENTFKKK